METTLEIARRCPKCQQPGDFAGKHPAPRTVTPGAMLHVFVCKNRRCRWFDTTCRIVQVNPDGSIPEPTMRRQKSFPAIPDRTAEVNAMTAAQLAAELGGDGEIRR